MGQRRVCGSRGHTQRRLPPPPGRATWTTRVRWSETQSEDQGRVSRGGLSRRRRPQRPRFPRESEGASSGQRRWHRITHRGPGPRTALLPWPALWVSRGWSRGRTGVRVQNNLELLASAGIPRLWRGVQGLGVGGEGLMGRARGLPGVRQWPVGALGGTAVTGKQGLQPTPQGMWSAENDPSGCLGPNPSPTPPRIVNPLCCMAWGAGVGWGEVQLGGRWNQVVHQWPDSRD